MYKRKISSQVVLWIIVLGAFQHSPLEAQEVRKLSYDGSDLPAVFRRRVRNLIQRVILSGAKDLISPLEADCGFTAAGAEDSSLDLAGYIRIVSPCRIAALT